MISLPRTAECEGWVSIAEGRTFAYREYGDPSGFPLIALHGTPGSRLKFASADRVARSSALRIIAPDRWGYGGTALHPSPTLAAFATDLASLADRLGIGRFAVLGISGGGPYAAAAASILPARVSALALVAPVGLVAGEKDSEISHLHRFCFGYLSRNAIAVRAIFRLLRRALDAAPDLAVRLAMLRACAADQMLLASPELRADLAATFIEGLRPGVHGVVTDLALFGAHWGIGLGNARMPAKMWLGCSDRNVPLSAARRLARSLPACDVVELPREGHFWIARNYDHVLAWISETTRSVGDAPAVVSLD